MCWWEQESTFPVPPFFSRRMRFRNGSHKKLPSLSKVLVFPSMHALSNACAFLGALSRPLRQSCTPFKSHLIRTYNVCLSLTLWVVGFSRFFLAALTLRDLTDTLQVAPEADARTLLYNIEEALAVLLPSATSIQQRERHNLVALNGLCAQAPLNLSAFVRMDDLSLAQLGSIAPFYPLLRSDHSNRHMPRPP
jgi:hypothetical protein